MENINKYVKLDKKEEQELKNNYYEHLKDGKFKDLCDHIDASDDIKMKYTSLLVDSSIEFSNCSKCKSLKTCKNNIKGFMYTPVVNNKTISFDYLACKYKNKEINDNRYLENIELFQISDSLKKMEEYLERHIKNKPIEVKKPEGDNKDTEYQKKLLEINNYC